MNIQQGHIWQALENMAALMKQTPLHHLFAQDVKRVDRFSLEVGNIYLDYSKNFLNNETIVLLIELANQCDLSDAISELFSGAPVNTTENRPALHTALRHEKAFNNANLEHIVSEVHVAKQKMFAAVTKLQTKQWFGSDGKAITDVVNLGIGGSDLGPVMALEALKPYQCSSLRVHFVSNVDPSVIYETLKELIPSQTLFVVSSKSFNTPETLTNLAVAKEWLEKSLGKKVENHFIAVTANVAKAELAGFSSENILPFWDWVGGRFSIWSAIGFPLALSIGSEHFEAFLQGARLMDEHFASAPLACNMPVILGLIGIWYINFWQASTIAVLPYAQGLRRLPDYLQQLDMESNGKSRKISGDPVNYATAPIVWGQAGTNGQHAFYQLLHQGTHFIPIDFIVPAKGNTPLLKQHQQLVANCFAQAQALMQGNQTSGIHDEMPGNKPSNTLLLTQITPSSLGQLLALYEHKIFVQGRIWQINSFDQPGVELGKKLAKNLMDNLGSGEIDPTLDLSTQKLIQKLLSNEWLTNDSVELA